ncbi:hypothetical protein IMZ48_37575, partial [Candidatus Bathyarchaeota archaeon]|nr:hypothetical protein [Candidatus Bathyarchaeota archaeon]
MGGNIKFELASKIEPPLGRAARDDDSIKFQAPGSDTIFLREQVPRAPQGMHQYRMPDGSFNNILDPDLGRAGTPYAKSVRATKSLHGVKPDPALLFDLLMERDDKAFEENPAGVSSMFYYHAAIIIHDIFRTNRGDQNTSDTSSYLDLAPLYGSSLKEQHEVRTMQDGMLKPDTVHEKRLLGLPPGVNA